MNKSFEEIVQTAELLEKFQNESDRHARWNLVQLGGALRLIQYFFGHKWYQKMMIDAKPPYVGALNFERNLSNTKSQLHPLSRSLWSGQPEDHLRLFGLGVALKTLGFADNDTKLSTKIAELKGNSFSKAFFELKIATTYALSGFSIEFLKPSKGQQSPDVAVISKCGPRTVVECKKREIASTASLSTRINGVLDRLREAHAQIMAGYTHGIVCIEVEEGLLEDSSDINSYVQAIQNELRLLTKVSGVILSWEQRFQNEELTNIITPMKGILNPSPASWNSIPVELLCNPANLVTVWPPIIDNLENAPTIG